MSGRRSTCGLAAGHRGGAGARAAAAHDLADPRRVAAGLVPSAPEITDPSQVRGAVEGIRDEGYEAIKVYNHLSAAVYEALVAEGRRVGVPVVGHVPFAVGIGGALAAGQRSIEHFRGYDFDPDHPPGASGVPERFRTWLSLTERQLAAYAEATPNGGRLELSDPRHGRLPARPWRSRASMPCPRPPAT
jgi:hypothetical protein